MTYMTDDMKSLRHRNVGESHGKTFDTVVCVLWRRNIRKEYKIYFSTSIDMHTI